MDMDRRDYANGTGIYVQDQVSLVKFPTEFYANLHIPLDSRATLTRGRPKKVKIAR